jgi:hypothetical protein
MSVGPTADVPRVKARIAAPSRVLDVHRWSDYPELRNCLTDLVAEINATEKRVRARTPKTANQFRDAVRCIILDLYVAWCADPNSEIGMPLGKSRFGRRTRYDALFLTYDTFHPAFTGLVVRGYAEVTRKAFHDPRTGVGRVTRVRATPKLIELLTGVGKLTLPAVSHRTDSDARESIILRNEDKEPVEYRDTAITRAMRADLVQINETLARHWIDLYLTDEETTALNALMTTRHQEDEQTPPYVNLATRQLRRIFNNRDWQQGGRFYGGWWQTIPKQYRAHITINDKHTVEVDYSGMHPALMYAAVDAKLDGDDAYDIGAPRVKRDLIKQTFNQLVNAEGRIEPKSDFNAVECGMSWKELQERVIARHQPIAQFLGTGHGVFLQNKDAIIANRIMLRFLAMGYACLPVHDSFIVHHALKDELTEIMRDEFHKEAGANVGTKPKWDVISASNSREPTVQTNFIEMDEPFACTDKYTGYETRLDNWRSSQG